MQLHVIKRPDGALIPALEHDREKLSTIKIGQPCRIELKRQRNYTFHKKYFALLEFAFDQWNPPEHGEGSAWKERITINRNFDRFRKDIIILAGYYEATYRLNGDVRIEAKSISFASMSQDEFEELYNATLTVIVEKVLQGYDSDALREILEQLDGFA